MTDTLIDDFHRRKFRAAFVEAHAKQSLTLQISDLLEQCRYTQKELADKSGLTQGTISRAMDPAYGNLTINTLVRIAAGFDVAFVCGFVSFGQFLKWADETRGELRLQTFTQEFPTVSSSPASADAPKETKP